MPMVSNKSRARAILLLSAATMFASGAPTFAQEASKGLPPIKFTFANGGVATLYGQINKGVLQYDDGQETNSYGLIDNDNSSTRFGLKYARSFGAWSFENVNEFKYAPFSTSDTNIENQTPTADDWRWSNANIRKIDFTLKNDSYGKFWIGQGSMATDGTLEVDLSGTDVVAYSSVADSASAQLLRFSDGTLSTTELGDVFNDLDGDRRVRVRYDTPSFANFTFAAAFGRNLLSDNPDVRDANLFDASINYDNTLSDAVELKASFGYNWKEGVAGGDDSTSWGGSASGIHTPTGLNLTVSAGTEDTGGDSSNFWYTKLGLKRDFISWGSTAMSIDYYKGTDFGLDAEAGITGSDSKSWGIGFVQKIDRANTDLWLTYRQYQFSDNVNSYDDGTALFGGARFKF